MYFSVFNSSRLLLLIIPLLLFSTDIYSSSNEICAEVSIKIAQELTIERQGFEATLEIENVLPDKPLNNISVDVLFNDQDGNNVLASSDPNHTQAKFFIRRLSQQGLTSTGNEELLSAEQKAVITWLIVPAPGAALGNETGTLYWVGANFNYTLDGVEESIPVVPDTIFVKPMPSLALDYFLPEYVYADNPFTPEIEPQEPFPLCVLISNSGKGIAKKVKIDSAQPEIVDNEQGLAVQFEIIGASVDNTPVQPSLLVDFGDIESNNSKSACWRMQTSLSGKFKNFTASYSHSAELGGELTSLLTEVNTHTLLQRVLVQLPGHDQVPDLLTNDAGITRVYDTEGTVHLVKVVSTAEKPLIDNKFELPAIKADGLYLIQLPAPSGHITTPSVLRSDGKHIAPQNVWISKKQIGNTQAFDYSLNIFDTNPNGRFILDYAENAADNLPPIIPIMPLTIGFTTEPLFINFTVIDPNKDPLTISWGKLPPEMHIEQIDGNNVQIVWTPNESQRGQYRIDVSAFDGQLTSTTPFFIEVRSHLDRDADGLPDEWELQHFNDLNQSANGDYDGDGISNLEESMQGLDPTMPDGPRAPTIISPKSGYTDSATPELVVQNADYKGEFNVIYEFEVYTSLEDTPPIDAYYAVVEGDAGATLWQPTKSLKENQQYFWRVRANNGHVKSLWAYGEFTVNAVNEAPNKPFLLSPVNNGVLDQFEPNFTAQGAGDPDGDAVAYRFEVFSDRSLNVLVMHSEWSEPVDNLLQWQPSKYLTPEKTYFWQIVAQDPHREQSHSEVWQFTASEYAITPEKPQLQSPKLGERISTDSPKLIFIPNSSNIVERTHYMVEVDTSEQFNSEDYQTYTIPVDANDFSVPLSGLRENTSYFWRVRAIIGTDMISEWSTSNFFVNSKNTPPPQPEIKNPGHGSWVPSLMPQLAVHQVVDIDLDKVSYEFELYSDASNETPFWSMLSDTPDAVVTKALQDNYWYAWRVRSIDESQAKSNWTKFHRFFTDSNNMNDIPEFTWLHSSEAIMQSRAQDIQLNWSDEDLDSSAFITLYYVLDGTNEEIIIADNIPEDKDGQFDQWLWETTNLEQGVYRLYVRIKDEENTVVVEAPFIYVLSNQYFQAGQVKFVDNHYQEINEGSGTHSAALVLTHPPLTKVIVSIDNGSESIDLLNNDLVFTPENWDMPQTIQFSVEDDCTFQWYQPIVLTPIVEVYNDPHYPPTKHNALLGHVINNEPPQSISPLAELCGFNLINVDKHANGYLHNYVVTVKSKHTNKLTNLVLSASSWNTKIITKEVHIPLLKAGETIDIEQQIQILAPSPNPVSTKSLNWSLHKSNEAEQ